MATLAPLTGQPLPPPSPSHTHSSASSRSRAHDLRSLSSHESDCRHSDWSSSDAERDDGDDDAFDLVSSAELPPPVVSSALHSHAHPARSTSPTSESDSASADEAHVPSKMRLSYPDPLDASSSSADDAPRDCAESHLDNSILLDGEGAYSLLLDARDSTSVSESASAPARETGSGLTSPLLRAQEPRAEKTPEIEGVEEWVRRTRLTVGERNDGTHERGVQASLGEVREIGTGTESAASLPGATTARNIEAWVPCPAVTVTLQSERTQERGVQASLGGDSHKPDLAASAISSMEGSSLVSSQATVVPSKSAVVELSAFAPVELVVPVRTAGEEQLPVSAPSHTRLRAQRRRALVVALAVALVATAAPFLATRSGRAGMVDIVSREQSDVAKETHPSATVRAKDGEAALREAGWLESILHESGSSSSSPASVVVELATASPAETSEISNTRLADSATPVVVLSDAFDTAASVASLAHPETPCAVCALSTLPATRSHALAPFAPARPLYPQALARKGCEHARRRRSSEGGPAREGISLFRHAEVRGAEPGRDAPREKGGRLQAALALLTQRLASADRLLHDSETRQRVHHAVHRAGSHFARAVPRHIRLESAHVGTVCRRSHEHAARFQHGLCRLARSARDSTRDTVLASFGPDRRAPLLAAQQHVTHTATGLWHRTHRALDRARSRVHLPRGLLSELGDAAFRRAAPRDVGDEAALSCLHANTAARLRSAQGASAFLAGVVSDRARGGRKEGERHVRRAAKTVRRVQQRVRERVRGWRKAA